jgi:hypothetical protein
MAQPGVAAVDKPRLVHGQALSTETELFGCQVNRSPALHLQCAIAYRKRL